MDAGSPAAWVIAMACVALAAMGAAVLVALGAYKIGKLTGMLRKEGSAAPMSTEDAAEGDDSGEESESESGEEGQEKKKKGAGKKTKGKEEKAVSDDDWKWPVYDTWWSDATYRMERRLRVKEKESGTSTAPFEVTYNQRRGWPDEVTVKLRSKALVAVAKRCLANHSEELIVENPCIDGRVMFEALGALREACAAMAEDDRGHHPLRHLVRFLEAEYKDTIVHVERMAREQRASWALLWAFLPKDQDVYYKCSLTGQTLKGVVSFYYYFENMQGKHLQVVLKARNYDSRKYVSCSVRVTVDEFRSERPFEAIGLCPLSVLDAAEASQLEAMFLRNGRKFYDIVSRGSYYMQYEGPQLRMVEVNECWQLRKQKADGRVMLDLVSFARMNPGYPLGSAEPPTSCEGCGVGGGEPEEPSDAELKLAPAVVYGFSFAKKQWGGFDVNGLADIKFDDQAFDRDLVLSDPSRKQMLLALVTEYLCGGGEGVQRLDPISNKGDGCIFLCYGPPGTGKTLTAESLAEKLHRPLWSISVFELGTSAKELETTLIEILDIAAQWRAVLLLDEADIYLEKRASRGDPTRTAMTAIFLRLLEYYRGVLFLTTNRVASFDDAFCSRISMFLRYHRLAGAQREAVWSNLLARAGLADPDLQPFLHTPLNGREIRNAIRIAQTWAKSSGQPLTEAHVLEVVAMLGEFRHDLEGAIQDESDERSISRALASVRSLKIAASQGNDSDLNGTFVKVPGSSDSHDDPDAP